MIAAFDVQYFEDGSASSAALLFSDYSASESAEEFTRFISEASEYVPGEFYRRELPCILKLLRHIKPTPDEIVIDGYVILGTRPGLGQYLFESLEKKIPVVGVAKSKFEGSSAAEIFRGGSIRPLYVTSAGKNLQSAAEMIRTMHGTHRIPTLLKRVDLLARGRIQNHQREIH